MIIFILNPGNIVHKTFIVTFYHLYYIKMGTKGNLILKYKGIYYVVFNANDRCQFCNGVQVLEVVESNDQ